jgi:hypothetical protein
MTEENEEWLPSFRRSRGSEAKRLQSMKEREDCAIRQGRVAHKVGRPTYLTPDEEVKLVKLLQEWPTNAIPPTKKEVRGMVLNHLFTFYSNFHFL